MTAPIRRSWLATRSGHRAGRVDGHGTVRGGHTGRLRPARGGRNFSSDGRWPPNQGADSCGHDRSDRRSLGPNGHGHPGAFPLKGRGHCGRSSTPDTAAATVHTGRSGDRRRPHEPVHANRPEPRGTWGDPAPTAIGAVAIGVATASTRRLMGGNGVYTCRLGPPARGHTTWARPPTTRVNFCRFRHEAMLPL